MKFQLASNSVEEPVRIGMSIDCDHDVCITADGIPMLYITAHGYLMRCYRGDLFKSMGFKVNKEGQIETMDE